MRKMTMDVSKKQDGKYVKVGEVSYFMPDFEEMGLSAEVAVDKDGKAIEEEGLPVFKDDKHNWVLGAIWAAVKAQVRNRLVSGTADLKDGAFIADNIDDLIKEGERGAGSAEALAAIRELKEKFKGFAATLGKSAAAQTLLLQLFSNKVALATQSQANKEKMAGYIATFSEGLDVATLEKGERYIQSLLDICAAEVTAEDF
jgi:hypothetical protein